MARCAQTTPGPPGHSEVTPEPWWCGRFLWRAWANGEGSGCNASTMSKLFNGSVWKRTVVKDHNRFFMHHTCLCLCTTFHIEDWHDFLSKDGALGMQSRFLTFHISPRLDTANAVLDADVYQAGDADAPVHNASLPVLGVATRG